MSNSNLSVKNSKFPEDVPPLLLQIPHRSRIGSLEKSELLIFLSLLKKKWPFLLCLTIAAVSAAVWEHARFPSYQAKTMIYFQSSDTNPLQALTSKLSGENSGSTVSELPEKYFQHLQSYSFAQEAAQDLLKSPELEKIDKRVFFDCPNLIEWVKSIIFFSPNRFRVNSLTEQDVAEGIQYWVSFNRAEAGGVGITVNSPKPELSQLLANLIAATAAKSITNRNLKELNDADHYLDQELNSTSKKIEEAESSIEDYKRDNHILSIERGSDGPVSRIAAVQEELEELGIQLNENKVTLKSLDSQLQRQTRDYPSSAASGTHFGLSRRVNDLEESQKLLKNRKVSLQRVLDKLQANQNPRAEQTIFDLKKRMELEYSHFQDLKHQSFQVELQRIAATNKITIAAPVRIVSIARSISLTKKIILSIVLSLMVGIGVVRVIEFINPLVRAREDFESLGLNFLSAIPDLRSKSFLSNRRKRGAFTGRSGQLVLQTFKHLRTQILHFGNRNDLSVQVLTFISSDTNNGKSFIAKSLALSFSQLGKKTLLIDASAKSDKYDGPGLVDVLSGKSKFVNVCKKNYVAGLDLLPGGELSGDLASLFSEASLGQLMGDLRAMYSHIVIDTQPLSVSLDTLLLAKQADLQLVVAETGGTSLRDLERLSDLLLNEDHKYVMGILNRFGGARSSLFKVTLSEGNA